MLHRIINRLFYLAIFILTSVGVVCGIPIFIIVFNKLVERIGYTSFRASSSKLFISLPFNKIAMFVSVVLIICWVTWIYQILILCFKIFKINQSLIFHSQKTRITFGEFISKNISLLKQSWWSLLVPSLLIFALLTLSAVGLKDVSNPSKVSSSYNSVTNISNYYNTNFNKVQNVSESIEIMDLHPSTYRATVLTHRYNPDNNNLLTGLEFLGCGLSGMALSELVRIRRKRQMSNRKLNERIWLPTDQLKEFEIKVTKTNLELRNRIRTAFEFLASTINIEKFLEKIEHFKISENDASFYCKDSSSFNELSEHFRHQGFAIESSRNCISLNFHEIAETRSSEFNIRELPISFVCIERSAKEYTFINLFLNKISYLNIELDKRFLSHVVFEALTSELCGGIEEIFCISKNEYFEFVKHIAPITFIELSLESFIETIKPEQLLKNSLVVVIGIEDRVEEMITLIELILKSGSHLVIFGADDNFEIDFGSLKTNIVDDNVLGKVIRSKCSEVSSLRISDLDLKNFELLFSNLEANINCNEDQLPYLKLTSEFDNSIGTTVLEEKSYESYPVSTLGLKENNILIKVLGQVEIVGTLHPVNKTRLMESIVYIALHPKGVDKVIWATAIWPDQLLTRDSLNTAVWQIRRALGVMSDGTKHMPPSYSGILKFGSTVVTDYEIFRNLTKSTEDSDWEKAMSLVTGRPFEGLGDPNWITLEGYVSDIESRIVDITLQLAFNKTKARQFDFVIWVLRRALLAVPYDERLWRYLLITYSKAGNLAKLDSVMNEIAFVMESESDIYSGISDETVKLYRQLSGKDYPRNKFMRNLSKQVTDR